MIARVAVLLASACFIHAASAQTFPAKPLRIIVPFAPGGLGDANARTIGSVVADSIGQPVVVENRPGASSIIGMQACAKAPPDGYTVCLTTADSLSYNPHFFKNLPYDAEKDFVPVINLARSSSMVAAKANAPFNTFKEMIAYAKAKPGALNWGTWGAGSIPDVYLQWIKHQAGVDIIAVPYKGAGQAVPAVIAGEVDLTYQSIGTLLPSIKAGKLKSIAVVGNRRSPLLADVPSLAEEGADPGLRPYFGVFAPGGTPKALVDRLNAEFDKAIRTPRIQEFYRTITLEAVGGSSDEFVQFLREDFANSARVFRAIGVSPKDAPS